MTIEDFIRARLDEDERAAIAASVEYEGETWTAAGDSVNTITVSNIAATVEKAYNPGVAEHIARHDPASVLLRVAPLRELLEFYAEVRHIWQGDYLKADFTLGKLASIWRGHPDYRPEWNA